MPASLLALLRRIHEEHGPLDAHGTWAAVDEIRTGWIRDAADQLTAEVLATTGWQFHFEIHRHDPGVLGLLHNGNTDHSGFALHGYTAEEILVGVANSVQDFVADELWTGWPACATHGTPVPGTGRRRAGVVLPAPQPRGRTDRPPHRNSRRRLISPADQPSIRFGPDRPSGGPLAGRPAAFPDGEDRFPRPRGPLRAEVVVGVVRSERQHRACTNQPGHPRQRPSRSTSTVARHKLKFTPGILFADPHPPE